MIEYIVKVYDNGTRCWYNQNGQRHREDGPAIEWADGTKSWYRNGELHREDGPAVEWADGTKIWYRNGQCHREDGPAIEYANGTKIWYRNGQCHREDGPAVECADGTKEWWLNGKKVTEKEFNRRTSKVKELTVAEISELLGYEVKVVKG
jgi:antitoxin component YwqK of YwqJK toxin-antitoxin module